LENPMPEKTDEDRRNDDIARQQLAKEVSRITVEQTFDALGINISTTEGRQEFRELVSWIRGLQKASNRGGVAIFITIITILVTGLSYATWQGLKHFVNQTSLP
jgi:hypothetical protein